LSRAFRAIRGTPPSRYLHDLRLTQVRGALLSDGGEGSVTEIAMRFGFRELGRFAVDYHDSAKARQRRCGARPARADSSRRLL
jgi:AraC-like DNA-binding protein